LWGLTVRKRTKAAARPEDRWTLVRKIHKIWRGVTARNRDMPPEMSDERGNPFASKQARHAQLRDKNPCRKDGTEARGTRLQHPKFTREHEEIATKQEKYS